MVVGPAVIVGPTVVVSSGVSVVTGTVVDPVIVGPVTVVTIDVAPVVAVPVAVGTFVITVPSIVVTVGPTVVVGPSVVITVGPAVVVTVDPVVVIPSVVVGPWSAPEEVVEGSVATVVSAGVEELQTLVTFASAYLCERTLKRYVDFRGNISAGETESFVRTGRDAAAVTCIRCTIPLQVSVLYPPTFPAHITR